MGTRPRNRPLLLAAVAAAAAVASLPAEDGGLEQLRLRLNPEFRSWSPGYCVERCAEHLATLPEEVRGSVRYFDASTLPRERLPELTSSLLFAANSAAPTAFVSRPQAVPNTDGRLFWCDLRWFQWTHDQWEAVAKEDPYFREPLVPSDSRGLKFLKQWTRGNAVIRGDWFLYYLGDTTQFLKDNQVRADNAFYYTLVYGGGEREVTEDVVEEVKEQVQKTWQGRRLPDGSVTYTDTEGKYYPPGYQYTDTVVRKVPKRVTRKVGSKGQVPATLGEFEKFWEVDLEYLKKHPVDRFGVVDEGDSLVSYSNRVIRRVRTKLGVAWYTFDVFRGVGDQDFLETLPSPPVKFNAGEAIVQDGKGAQHYFLFNGQRERVEFGDPRVVRDHVSGEKGVVLTWKSCVACHTEGVIPVKNELPLLIKGGAELRLRDQHEFERVAAAYLQNLNRLVQVDQAEYREFVKACNGLTPEENAAQFGRIRLWYSQPLTLAQAARECGADVKEFSDAISIGTKGRIGRLLTDGKPIPRQAWEFGGYAEAFLLLLEYRKAARMRGFIVPSW